MLRKKRTFEIQTVSETVKKTILGVVAALTVTAITSCKEGSHISYIVKNNLEDSLFMNIQFISIGSEVEIALAPGQRVEVLQYDQSGIFDGAFKCNTYIKSAAGHAAYKKLAKDLTLNDNWQYSYDKKAGMETHFCTCTVNGTDLK